MSLLIILKSNFLQHFILFKYINRGVAYSKQKSCIFLNCIIYNRNCFLCVNKHFSKDVSVRSNTQFHIFCYYYLRNVALNIATSPSLNSRGVSPLLYNPNPLIFVKVVSSLVAGSFPFIFSSN